MTNLQQKPCLISSLSLPLHKHLIASHPNREISFAKECYELTPYKIYGIQLCHQSYELGIGWGYPFEKSNNSQHQHYGKHRRKIIVCLHPHRQHPQNIMQFIETDFYDQNDCEMIGLLKNPESQHYSYPNQHPHDDYVRLVRLAGDNASDNRMVCYNDRIPRKGAYNSYAVLVHEGEEDLCLALSLIRAVHTKQM